MPGRRVENGHRIIAVDGADEDGGTLYVLYNRDGEVRAAAAWPQPLELSAASPLHVVRRP